MLHIHFGAGRLGLGLIVPFFQIGNTRSFIVNRAISSVSPTGNTALSPRRRNDLLRESPDRLYVLQQRDTRGGHRSVVRYDGFFEFGQGGKEIGTILRAILQAPGGAEEPVLVTASLISAANYPPVLEALGILASMRARGGLGPIFLVTCENTLNAPELFEDPDLADAISDDMRRHVTPVPALVDRVCIGLEEGREGAHPAVVVSTEEYGSLKLELSHATEILARHLEGSGVEFTRYVAIEKRIKNWLLNGSHWLLALAAFQESQGDRELRLNDFLNRSAENRRFAEEVMREMHEGIAVILRREPEFDRFVAEVDPDIYLKGATDAILSRFLGNDDPMSRILARFQAPTPERPDTVEAFRQRFADRVDGPIAAYAETRGAPPPAATHSLESLARLIASGTYINAA
ncbi:hypothetical protein ACFQX4_09890 [Roseomonas sp. GCM10028921]